MARRIVDGEAPDLPIEAAKMVGMLSQQALDIDARLAKSIAICSFGNVATMSRGVS